MDELQFQIGNIYPKDNTILRILAKHEGDVLLEQWTHNAFTQYIVTNGLCLDNNELHWSGSGAYFPCMNPPYPCDTPFDALCKALEHMRGPRKVYALLGDTTEGASVSLHATYEDAEEMLQRYLGWDNYLQTLAGKLGVEKLTVDAYFAMYDKLCEISSRQLDEYQIEEHSV